MQAGNKWTELLTCPACGQSGILYLSQPEGRVYDFSVEAVPAAFKVVHTEYGETFFVALATNMPSPSTQAHFIRETSKLCFGLQCWPLSAPNIDPRTRWICVAHADA
jgi:hypothetical protein